MANENEPTKDAKPSHRDPPARFTVEVAGPRNQALSFAPMRGGYQGMPLRGRWVMANLRGSAEHAEAIEMIGDIPGLMLSVDCRRRIAKCHDPLSDYTTEQRRDLAIKVSALGVGRQILPGGIESLVRPWPTIERTELSDGELKTWCYHVRRALDSVDNDTRKETEGNLILAPLVIERDGRVPTMVEIMQMPGKTEIEQFNSSAYKNRYLEDQDKYREKIMRAQAG